MFALFLEINGEILHVDKSARVFFSVLVSSFLQHSPTIDQAGAFILKRRMDFTSYLECYNKQREKVLNEAPEI